MDMKPQETEIGTIGNYYGGLRVKTENDKFFWGIENWDGTTWEEISERLFNTLLEHNNE
jgi:hypothetical protein